MDIPIVITTNILHLFFLITIISIGITNAIKATPSNQRDFYIVLEGLGPTNGGSTIDTLDTKWASNLTWNQDYLAVSSEWDTPIEAIQQVRDVLNWSIYFTTSGSPTRQKNREKHRKIPMPNLTKAIETLTSAGIKMNEINWEYICEDDSGGTGYSPELFAKARKSGYSNGHSKLKPSTALEGWNRYLSEAKNFTEKFVNESATLFARSGFTSSAHSMLDYADYILVERANDDTGSLPPSIAFLRGAVEQYSNNNNNNNKSNNNKNKNNNSKGWGIDLSLWWGVINGCVNPYPASYHRRILWNTYFAGASILTVEGCGYIDTITKQPNPISDEIDSFGKFIKTKVPPATRGIHDSPIAVVLSEDNGWNERPSWGRGGQGTTIWNYANIAWYNQLGSGAVDGFFGMIYPGVDGIVGFRAFPFGNFENNRNPPPSVFARSSIQEPYAPNEDDVWTASSSLPFGKFHDRNESQAWFNNNHNNDPAEFRPMADTAFGDIFDVFVTGANKKINMINTKYKVLIWLSGNGYINNETKNMLEDFARDGGIVIVPIGSLAIIDDISSFSGVSVSGIVRVGRAYQFLKDSNMVSTTTIDDGVEMYNYADVEKVASDSKIIVQSIPEKHPVVVKRHVGKGSIYTCLIPWFEVGSGGLSTISKELFKGIIKPFQPISIEEKLNAYGLYWTSSTTYDVESKKDTRYISISNNAEIEWQGNMISNMSSMSKCKNMKSNNDITCEDLRKQEKLQICKYNAKDDIVTFSISVQKHDVTVVSISCQ